MSATDQCRHLPVVGHCGSVGSGRGSSDGADDTDKCCHGDSAAQTAGNACIFNMSDENTTYNL